MKYKIPFSKPSLVKSDFVEVKKCFDSSWVSSKSPWVEKFEKLFSKKVSKTKYAVSTNSCTSAIFLTLKALGVGEGDEVILPSFTMIATANAVVMVGAKPVLVDSASKEDWNMDIDSIEEKITKKTKAIIPVHIYGFACDMDRLNRLAKKHNLYVIEDAAEAMGVVYKGRRVGSLSKVSCFSLYANKIITAGNGGVVATDDSRLTDKLKRLRFFDFGRNSHYKHEIVGYNLVLSGLQAALAFSQLKRFNTLLSKRKRIFSWYKQHLEESEKVKFLEPVSDQAPNYWFPAAIFPEAGLKGKVKINLEKKGIETRGFFRPIHLQPPYKQLFGEEKYKFAEYFYKKGLLLPSYYDLKKTDVVRISEIINDVF